MSKGISASPLPDTEKSTPTRLVPGDELGSAESSNGEIEPDDAGDAEIVDGEPVDDVPEVIEERHRMDLEFRAARCPTRRRSLPTKPPIRVLPTESCRWRKQNSRISTKWKTGAARRLKTFFSLSSSGHR